MQTLLGAIGIASGILNSFGTEILANRLSVLEEMKAGVIRMAASWPTTALQTSIRDWKGTWHL